MNRQGFSQMIVDQAVGRVGQGAVERVMSGGAAFQYPGQPWMLVNSETSPQRFARQPVSGHGLQDIAFEFQQADRATGEVRSQWAKQILQAFLCCLFMTEFIQKQGSDHGCFYSARVVNTPTRWGNKDHDIRIIQ